MEGTESLYEIISRRISAAEDTNPISSPDAPKRHAPEAGFRTAKEYLQANMRIAAQCLHNVILNAYLDGADISSQMEQLKGICEQVVRVPVSGRRRIYFPLCSAAATSEIEQCIAVHTRDGNEGTLSHLTLVSDMGDFISWLEKNAKTTSKVYIVGGTAPESAEYLEKLSEMLARKGYPAATTDTLCSAGRGRDLIARRSGAVEVTLYQRMRGPAGEDKIIIGYNNFLKGT
jgi:hypothetical protein